MSEGVSKAAREARTPSQPAPRNSYVDPARRRPTPSSFAVVDHRGRVIWSGAEMRHAWRAVCDLPGARYMVDADDHARILAYRGKRRDSPEAS